MSLYQILIVIHVIVAVGGLGQLSVFSYMTRNAATANPQVLQQILKAAGGALVIMLLTGIWMLYLLDWMYERTWWFRISVVLFIALGAMHGITSKTLKKAVAEGGPLANSPLLPKLKTMSVLMSVTLILIVLLMEGKPF